jgi:hypothetical protein
MKNLDEENTSTRPNQNSEKHSPQKTITICSVALLVLTFQCFMSFARGSKVQGFIYAGLWIFFLIYLINTIRKKNL